MCLMCEDALQKKADFFKKIAAYMADRVAERIHVKDKDKVTEEVDKAFKAGCHVRIVMENGMMQHNVVIGATNTLSSDSSAGKGKGHRKVAFTTTEAITKRAKSLSLKVRANINQMDKQAAKAYKAQKVKQEKMKAENEEKNAKKAKVAVENDAMMDTIAVEKYD